MNEKLAYVLKEITLKGTRYLSVTYIFVLHINYKKIFGFIYHVYLLVALGNEKNLKILKLLPFYLGTIREHTILKTKSYFDLKT